MISKVLSNRIKNLLPNLISNNQNAYVANRFISEGGRSISDILEMIDILNMEGYLLTIDIEQAFDSIDHFLLAVLEKHGSKKNFLRSELHGNLRGNYNSLFQIEERNTPRQSDLCVLACSSVRSSILCN